jgi:hypothetical protein
MLPRCHFGARDTRKFTGCVPAPFAFAQFPVAPRRPLRVRSRHWRIEIECPLCANSGHSLFVGSCDDDSIRRSNSNLRPEHARGRIRRLPRACLKVHVAAPHRKTWHTETPRCTHRRPPTQLTIPRQERFLRPMPTTSALHL